MTTRSEKRYLDRVAQLEEERAALTTMLNLFDALKTPLSSS